MLGAGHAVCIVCERAQLAPSPLPLPGAPPSISERRDKFLRKCFCSKKALSPASHRRSVREPLLSSGVPPALGEPCGPGAGAAHGRGGGGSWPTEALGAAEVAMSWSSAGHMCISCSIWSGFNCLFSKPHFTQTCYKSAEYAGCCAGRWSLDGRRGCLGLVGRRTHHTG